MEALKAREEAMKWARRVVDKFPSEIREADKAHALAVFTEMALFEQPRPILEVSVKCVGDVYTFTVRGYTGVFDIKRWCEIFVHKDRHELLRRITWTGGQLATKEHAVVLSMDSSEATIVSRSGGGGGGGGGSDQQHTPSVRAHAVDFASNLVKTMNVREFDRQWVEAVLIEVVMFESPQPVLDITLDVVGDHYNITVHGYKNFVDYVRWCNRFLGKSRDKYLSHLVHTWQQTVEDRGPCLVLQMERTEFQTAPESAAAASHFAEPEPPSSRSRSRHRSKTPSMARHGSRSRSKKRYE
jgi:hypothetical protein